MSFVLGKLAWLFLSPGNLVALLLLLAAALVLWGGGGWALLGRGLLGLLAAGVGILLFVPVGDWLLRPLEARFPPPATDDWRGIIVLGGAEDPARTAVQGDIALNGAGERYIVALRHFHRHPERPLIFTGGIGRIDQSQVLRDADVAARVFADLAVDMNRIRFESASRNTWENARGVAAMLSSAERAEPWLLVTSAWHMPRAVGCFRRAGVKVVAAPADYRGGVAGGLLAGFLANLEKVTIAGHEYAGLLAYWLMGRTDALLPAA